MNKDKEGVDREKWSMALNDVKPIENTDKNPQSSLGISAVQKKCLVYVKTPYLGIWVTEPFQIKDWTVDKVIMIIWVEYNNNNLYTVYDNHYFLVLIFIFYSYFYF